MAQGPLQVSASVRPNAAQTSRAGSPMLLDPAQTLLVGKGLKSALNKTAGTTLIQGGVGRIAKVIVNTVDSTNSGIYDAAAVGGVAAGTLVFAIPKTVGIYDVDFPIALGLVLVVGTAGVMSISYQ